MASTVTSEQLTKLTYTIGPKATSLSTAVIRLHSASNDDKKWLYTGLCGALCFVIDRQLGGVAVFRMYDLNSYSVLFEAQLYCEFEKHYTEVNDNFYCFPIPGNHCIGFSFADSDEALSFKSLVERYSPKAHTQEKVVDRIKRMRKAEQSSPKKARSFLKRLFFGGLGKKQQKCEETNFVDNLKISRPENAVHENHIGWDSKNQTFDLSQLSKELKRVFKKAGIKKRDLKDTNTALLIAETILNQPLPDMMSSQVKKPMDKGGLIKKDLDDLTNSRRSSKDSNMKPVRSASQSTIADGQRMSMQNKLTSTLEKKSHNLSKQDEMSLTSKLAAAMAARRKQLTKHDVESEEDDWSDDDL